MTLPHTGDILLVNSHKIIDEHSIEAEYQIPNDHPVLKDHFPNTPVWPGVYLIEGMCQTAGLHAVSILSTNEIYGTPKPKIPLVTTVDEAKFRRVVLPGQTLKYTATRAYSRRNHVFYICLVYVDDVKVAQAKVGLTAK